MKTLFVIAALAAIAAPAAAQVNSDAPRAVIRYSDLDLSRPSGADAMIGRIRQAALSVCGDASSTRGLARVAEQRACMAETMVATVKQVNAPLVSQRFGLAANPAHLAAK
jgi:UrcA family protein